MNDIGIEHFAIILIEKFPCNCKEELEARERYYIELLKAQLNKNLPTRNNKEWKKDNKEHLKDYQKKYQKPYQYRYSKQNKEIIAMKKRIQYSNRKDKQIMSQFDNICAKIELKLNTINLA